MTAAVHQAMLDTEAEIGIRTEQLEQEAREALLNCGRYSFPVRLQYGRPVEESRDESDVMEALYDIAEDELKLALSFLDKDPLEAVRILKESRQRAVEQVLGQIDFDDVARLEIEINERNAA
jgi:hypothetical protein